VSIITSKFLYTIDHWSQSLKISKLYRLIIGNEMPKSLAYKKSG